MFQFQASETENENAHTNHTNSIELEQIPLRFAHIFFSAEC